MKKKLCEALFGMEKLDALATVFDRLYLDYTVPPDEQERLDHGAYVFQAIRDEIALVKDELEEMTDM